MRSRASRFLVLVLLGFSSLAACGSERGVHVIPLSDLPDDLYASPTPTAPAAPRETLVYFIRGERVAAVERVAASASGVAEFSMRELLAGPRPEELDAGLTTAIPEGTELLGVTVQDGVAFVDLSREFELGAAQEVLLERLSQVVYTLTELRRVEGVHFLIDGEAVNVVDQDGTVLDVPVTRRDYAALAPPTA